MQLQWKKQQASDAENKIVNDKPTNDSLQTTNEGRVNNMGNENSETAKKEEGERSVNYKETISPEHNALCVEENLKRPVEKSITTSEDNPSTNEKSIKKSKKIGPTIPENLISQSVAGSGCLSFSFKKPKHDKTKNKLKDDNYSEDPNYQVWLPPEDQSGDGKTKLNEKYGY